MATAKYKYKNISGQEQAVIGYGNVKKGATIETDQEINNPNFELVFDGDDRVGVESKPKKPTK